MKRRRPYPAPGGEDGAFALLAISIMKNSSFIILVFVFVLFSCQHKTYLSDEFKEFVPYTLGQELVFVSSKGDMDKLVVTSIEDNKFPDGIGAPSSEILTVSAERKPDTRSRRRIIPILSGIAEYNNKEEQIIFEILLGKVGTKQRAPFSTIRNREVGELITIYGQYEDVLYLEITFDFVPKDSHIISFYWSLSKGYVRFIQYDGTIWDLKE